MIGWLCCSGLSEGAHVGTGSPPWYLLSDRWSVRSKGILIIACRGSAMFLQCSSVLRVANPSDRGLPTCERSLSFRATLLCYYGVQGGKLHVECICSGMDAVALCGPDLQVPYSDIS
jgi:hypothetical protein